jgi:hypothetical protein
MSSRGPVTDLVELSTSSGGMVVVDTGASSQGVSSVCVKSNCGMKSTKTVIANQQLCFCAQILQFFTLK